MKKITAGRVVLSIIYVLITGLVLSMVTIVIYNKQIVNPRRIVPKEETTGYYAIITWLDDIKSPTEDMVEVDLEGGVKEEKKGKTEYLKGELGFVNGNKNREEFISSIIKNTYFVPKKEYVKDKYGIEKTDMQLDMAEDGMKIGIAHLDYDTLDFTEADIETYIKNNKININSDYFEDDAIDIFCYLAKSKMNNMALKSTSLKVGLVVEDNKLAVSESMDATIDNILFSSESFYNCLDRYTKVLNSVISKDKEKDSVSRGVFKQNGISKSWCGIYNLLSSKELNEVIVREGDGTKENPAGVGTKINVVLTRGDKKFPLSVTLRNFYINEDAIKWLNSKDERNRGLDIKSEFKYFSMSFEITNLSNSKVVVDEKDCVTITDEKGNRYKRSGTMFGYTSSITLKPGESGVLESWSIATKVDKKYLTFSLEDGVDEGKIWYKVLALDDRNSSDVIEDNLEEERD